MKVSYPYLGQFTTKCSSICIKLAVELPKQISAKYTTPTVHLCIVVHIKCLQKNANTLIFYDKQFVCVIG